VSVFGADGMSRSRPCCMKTGPGGIPFAVVPVHRFPAASTHLGAAQSVKTIAEASTMLANGILATALLSELLLL
jgi:hypothetical protein